MRADGDARRAVVREHPLPRRVVAKRGRHDRWIERECELPLLPTRTGHRFTPGDEAELPEQHTTRRCEAIAGAAADERLKPVLRQLRALRKVHDVGERPPALALLHERLRIVLPDRLHILEADAHRVVFDARLRVAAVHIRR